MDQCRENQGRKNQCKNFWKNSVEINTINRNIGRKVIGGDNVN